MSKSCAEHKIVLDCPKLFGNNPFYLKKKATVLSIGANVKKIFFRQLSVVSHNRALDLPVTVKIKSTILWLVYGCQGC